MDGWIERARDFILGYPDRDDAGDAVGEGHGREVPAHEAEVPDERASQAPEPAHPGRPAHPGPPEHPGAPGPSHPGVPEEPAPSEVPGGPAPSEAPGGPAPSEIPGGPAPSEAPGGPAPSEVPPRPQPRPGPGEDVTREDTTRRWSADDDGGSTGTRRPIL